MNLCNETITVFNHKLDKVQGYDVLNGTVISGVSWYGSRQSGSTSNGLRRSDSTIVRIPTDADFGGASYVDSKAYAEMDDVSGVFTLKPDDIIVHGSVETDGQTAAQLHGAYETMVIMSVTDDRRAPNAPHFKVTGG